MDALAADDSHDEGPVSYIPSPELEALSDAKIEIEGRRLVLHSQVLATQSGVLRDVFLTREEAGQQVCWGASPLPRDRSARRS